MELGNDCRPLASPCEGAHDSTVHALALFNERLYCAVISERRGTPVQREALIVRATPALDGWEELYRRSLPLDFIKINGQIRRVGLDQGFRAFVIGPLPGGGEAALMTALVSIKGSSILATVDGTTFEEWPNPSPAPGVPPLGELRPFGGRLYAVPAGPLLPPSDPRQRRKAADIFVAEDVRAGAWRAACEPGFGEDANYAVCHMATAEGALFAATSNPLRGFELWKGTADDGGAVAWQRILEQGAFRYTLNKAVTAMTEWDGALYLATAALAPGKIEVGDHGPEILRVGPDKAWDIIVGLPRFTPEGLKVPLSACGPGFGDTDNGAFTQVVRTAQGMVACKQTFLPLNGEAGSAAGDYLDRAEIWTSANGLDWEERSGLDLPDLDRVRAACAWGEGVVLGGRTFAPEGEEAAPSPLVLISHT